MLPSSFNPTLVLYQAYPVQAAQAKKQELLIPSFTTPKELAKSCRVSPGELGKVGRGLFDWYPKDKDIHRVGLGDSVGFSFPVRHSLLTSLVFVSGCPFI